MGAPEHSFQAVTCAWPETETTFSSSSVCLRFRSMLLSLLSVFSYFFQKPPKVMSKPEGDTKERTFIAIKPDGVQRGLVGKIIARFEEKGFKLVAMKFMHASEAHLQEHYSDLSKKPFFPGLVKYMASGPLVAMVWEGLGVVKTGRKMLGETNPADSLPGTIRGDYCIHVGRNICHGSDSVESAQKEISLWFKDAELVCYDSCGKQWLYE